MQRTHARSAYASALQAYEYHTTASPPEQDPLWKLTWYMYRPGMEF